MSDWYGIRSVRSGASCGLGCLVAWLLGCLGAWVLEGFPEDPTAACSPIVPKSHGVKSEAFREI